MRRHLAQNPMSHKKSDKRNYSLVAFGRDEATRTPDPYVPNVVRYQLRYIPISGCNCSANREQKAGFMPRCSLQSQAISKKSAAKVRRFFEIRAEKGSFFIKWLYFPARIFMSYLYCLRNWMYSSQRETYWLVRPAFFFSKSTSVAKAAY